jgi:hypothetical protein
MSEFRGGERGSKEAAGRTKRAESGDDLCAMRDILDRVGTAGVYSCFFTSSRAHGDLES